MLSLYLFMKVFIVMIQMNKKTVLFGLFSTFSIQPSQRQQLMQS